MLTHFRYSEHSLGGNPLKPIKLLKTFQAVFKSYAYLPFFKLDKLLGRWALSVFRATHSHSPRTHFMQIKAPLVRFAKLNKKKDKSLRTLLKD